MGDLDELYAERVARGRVRADAWYARQLLSAAFHYRIRKWQRSAGTGIARVLSECRSDLGYAIRVLRHRPGFTVIVVLTLALGIGANTVIFSVVDAVLLKPLPLPEPERLVRLLHQRRGDETRPGRFSREDFADFEASRSPAVESVAAYTTGIRVFTGHGDAAELSTTYVSTDFFRAMLTGAVIGRTFRPEENVPGSDRVAVLSDAFWRSRFASHAGVIGTSITLDGEPVAVAGVMPPGFEFPADEAGVCCHPASSPIVPAQTEPAEAMWMPWPRPADSQLPRRGGYMLTV